jgi:NTP pyrophosphatase (non-canonical NTP hydrolase)
VRLPDQRGTIDRSVLSNRAIPNARLSPKNLASALIVEAGELLEHFQWMTEAQSRALAPDQKDAVAAEIADVLLYLVQLSTALDIDPVAAAQAKMLVNARKYPPKRGPSDGTPTPAD